MQLLIIRHAIAQDKNEFAKTGNADDQRPITDEGRQKMIVNARGLRVVVPKISLLATSPFTRAVETAEIVARAYEMSVNGKIDALRSDGDFDDLLEWLDPMAAKDVVAVVGHEPHLTGLTSWLISGKKDVRLDLKKGGAILLEFGGKPKRAGATLLWSIAPAQLRSLANTRE